MIGPNNGVPFNVLATIPKSLHSSIRDGKNTTDLADYVQIALDDFDRVYFPYGVYKISSVNLKFHQLVYGDNMDSTVILPMAGGNTFVFTSDFITLRDLSFRDTALAYAESSPTITANCILIDAVTTNAAFTRALQGIEIEKVLFMNIDGAAIDMQQALRESFIEKCRFFGMGSVGNSKGVIHGKETLGSGTNTNNLWINKNEFYRYAMPPINLLASTVLANNVPSYADIHMAHNLIHNQKLDTSSNVQTVEAEATDNVYMERVADFYFEHNKVTSIHPDYEGLTVANHANYELRHASIIGNRFAIDTGRGDLTYPGSGDTIQLNEIESFHCIANTFDSGNNNSDITTTRTAATAIKQTVIGNQTDSGSLVFTFDTWDGISQTDEDTTDFTASTIENLIANNLTVPPVDKTIAAGVIAAAADEGFLVIDTESAAATDDLDTITNTGNADGRIITLKAKDGTHTVVVKHNTSNIYLGNTGADISLDDQYKTVRLQYNAEVSRWLEI